ncbi:MAG TPA: hypothetical protein VGB93_00985, partial [Methylovirgula sp.]
MFKRKPRYRNTRLKAGRDKTILRCHLVSPATVPTNKSHSQFLIIIGHHMVSTYFRGHLMHQSTQPQKVQRNSRLRFTNEAKYEAERSLAHLTLIDSDRLVNLLIEYYEKTDAETRTLVPLR